MIYASSGELRKTLAQLVLFGLGCYGIALVYEPAALIFGCFAMVLILEYRQ